MRKRQDPLIRQSAFLDAAERLFFSKGYDKTSITDILDAVGDASPSVFYYYFSSKESIFKATMKRYVEIRSKEMINEILSIPVYSMDEIKKLIAMEEMTISDFERVDGFFNKSASDSNQFHQALMEESMHLLQSPLQKYIENMIESDAVQATSFLKEAGAATTTTVFLHAVFALFHKDTSTIVHTDSKFKLIPLLVIELIGPPTNS